MHHWCRSRPPQKLRSLNLAASCGAHRATQALPSPRCCRRPMPCHRPRRPAQPLSRRCLPACGQPAPSALRLLPPSHLKPHPHPRAAARWISSRRRRSPPKPFTPPTVSALSVLACKSRRAPRAPFSLLLSLLPLEAQSLTIACDCPLRAPQCCSSSRRPFSSNPPQRCSAALTPLLRPPAALRTARPPALSLRFARKWRPTRARRRGALACPSE